MKMTKYQIELIIASLDVAMCEHQIDIEDGIELMENLENLIESSHKEDFLIN